MDDDAHHQTVLGVTHRTHHRRRRLLAVNHDSTSQPVERLGRGEAVEQRFVFLVDLKARVHDAMGDLAVVGQQQKSLGLPVKATHWHDASFDAHEIHHGVASAFVVSGGDVALGFVEQDIASALVRNQVPVDLDLLAISVNFRAEFRHHDSIDAYAALDDHLFRPATGRDAARRQDSL